VKLEKGIARGRGKEERRIEKEWIFGRK